MPYEIRVPRLGWSMDEGTFVGWLKAEGSEVRVGEPLFEIESDKAVEPVEALDAGTLHVPPDGPEPGSTVRVGALLGYLLMPGEAPAGTKLDDSATQDGTFEAKIDVSMKHTSRRSSVGPVASPRARRTARALGVDWRTLRGTGTGGRVREADVRAALAAKEALSAPDGVITPFVPLSPRRKAIADHLRSGQALAVPVTLTTIADATELVALRERFKAVRGVVVPSYVDLVSCLVARVLIQHPDLAMRWDTERRSLARPAADAIDIGIAVDTSEGLLVPVVRDVARRTPIDVAVASARLIDKARSGGLPAAAMSGGVFTITNLGTYRVDAFTPVINPPEVAILGLGMIRREPVVMPDGWIAPRHRMTLSLTFDHAALDGAPAASFLRAVALAMEGPDSILGDGP